MAQSYISNFQDKEVNKQFSEMDNDIKTLQKDQKSQYSAEIYQRGERVSVKGSYTREFYTQLDS